MSSRGTYLYDTETQRVLPKDEVMRLRALRKTHGRSTVHEGRTVERGHWIWDKRQMKLVPRAEYRPYSGVTIIKDIEPYQAVFGKKVGGKLEREVIGGRKQHNDALRARGVIEVGNEKITKQYEAAPGLRDDMRRALQEHGGLKL